MDDLTAERFGRGIPTAELRTYPKPLAPKDPAISAGSAPSPAEIAARQKVLCEMDTRSAHARAVAQRLTLAILRWRPT